MYLTRIGAGSMNKQMIENSDRGITLAKPLAWAVLVFLLGSVWTGGNLIGNIRTTQASNIDKIEGLTKETSEIQGRIRVLENLTNRLDENIQELRRGVEAIQTEQRETNRLLREYLAGE